MEAYREELIVQLAGQSVRVFRNNRRVACVMVQQHWHDACEVLLIRRGWGRQRINAETRTIHQGDAVLICPGDIHATEALAQEGMDVDVLQFNRDVLSDSGRVWQELKSGIVRSEEASMQELFGAFFRHAGDRGPERRLLMTGLAQVLLAVFMRSGQEGTNSARSDVMEEICAYVEEADDLRLERTAAHFGYCPEHLSRRFRSEIGMTYRAYCDQVRMKRAAGLLHAEGESISSVAEQLGYSDDSSFIRAFRRLYGITPSAYRRLCLPVGRGGK